MTQLRELSRTRIRDVTWFVKREGTLDEVQMEDGTIRYKVQVLDLGREPFVTQWFNDFVPASGFLEKIQEDNEQYHTIRMIEKEEDNG